MMCLKHLYPMINTNNLGTKLINKLGDCAPIPNFIFVSLVFYTIISFQKIYRSPFYIHR